MDPVRRGRPVKYHTEEERRAAKRAQVAAHQRKMRAENREEVNRKAREYAQRKRGAAAIPAAQIEVVAA